jgi:hypothetical protein
MAAIAKKQSSTGWWLWGGVAVAIIAVAAVIYTFDPFGFVAPASDPVLTAPLAEQPAPAPTN